MTQLSTTQPRMMTAEQIDGVVDSLLQLEESCALIRCALESEEPGRSALNGAMTLLDEAIEILEILRTKLPVSESPAP